jgi:hypothetical protein
MPCGSNRGCKMLADPMRYSTRCSIARAANVSVSSASLSRNLGQDNDLRAVPNSIFSRLEQQISRACSIDQRSSLLEADGELWAECAKIGDMGYTSLVEDPEADVEPHFVCFAGLNGQLAMFDGDRTSGPLVLHIALGVGGLIPDQAKDAVMDHLNMYAGENRDFSTLLALVDNAIGNAQILPHHIADLPTTA